MIETAALLNPVAGLLFFPGMGGSVRLFLSHGRLSYHTHAGRATPNARGAESPQLSVARMKTLTMGTRRWIVRVALPSLVLLLAFGCRNPTPAPPFDAAEAERAVREVLRRQVDAWNRGDVEAFMDGYARTDSLRFASGGTVRA